MESIFEELARLLESGQQAVLATVVASRGSTPQKPGARLLVRGDGSMLGTLGGGCVEAEAWQEAIKALSSGAAALCQFTLNEELAADSGLLCGGTMEVLIDPWRKEDLPLARAVATALAGGPRAALATVVRGDGIGAKMVIRDDGVLGDATLQAEIASTAQSLQQPAETVRLSTGQEALVETFLSPPTLLIAGAGHVGLALATLAQFLGFRVVVADDRADFASRERFPQAHALLVGDIEYSIGDYPANERTFVVIATRGHKLDYEALRAAARGKARYLGLVGSKRKVVLIFKQLVEDGIPAERLKDIRAPVGLDLGGRTPQEIALSILSEIVMEQHGGSGRSLRMGVERAPGANP